MQTTKKNLSDTKVQLTIVAEPRELASVKGHILAEIGQDMSLPGFRRGKVPKELVEKNANPSTMQTEFLDHAINQLFSQAVREERLRPVQQPEVKINKFVPFTTLEVTLEMEVVGDVELADYKKMRLVKKPVSVTAKDVQKVVDQLKERNAEKKEVTRAAKKGDEVSVDFSGVDAKTKEPINGATGKEYPLLLGSNTFIPGFETNLIGLKTGDEKTFPITFPKDYSVQALQGRKASFSIKVVKVQEVIEPKVDNTFAAKAGPFKTVADMEADIRKQLKSEKEYQGEREYMDELLVKIANASKVTIPNLLIDQQLERDIEDQRRNLVYRGMTWQEFLDSQGLTEETYRAQARPQAEFRVKVGILLSEIADKEDVRITPAEVDARIEQLKAQYPDQQMQVELDRPEGRNEIASRMVSEITAAKLMEYASKK